MAPDQISVTDLFLHPVKSCHRVRVDQATTSSTGLVGDREWQVSRTSDEGEITPVTQRQKTLLTQVQPELIDGGLRLSAPDQPTIEVATPTAADAHTVTLIGLPALVGDAGDEAATWFAQLLDDPSVRLHGLTATSDLAPPDALNLFQSDLSFVDLAPVLVTSAASLEWLVGQAIEPFEMARFRPNIVLDGGEPFTEETWSRLRVGGCRLDHGISWPRCPIPQVDQETGDRHREPALVLKEHRFVTSAPEIPAAVRPIMEGSAIFGMGYGIGPAGSTISVGDTVEVVETMEPLLAPPQA